MALSIEDQKRDMRRRMRERLRAVSSADRAAAGQRVSERLESSAILSHAMTILAFYPMQTEIDIVPYLNSVLDSGARLVLPRVDDNVRLDLIEVENLDAHLSIGAYGIMEPSYGLPPVSPSELDAIVAPGLAFALTGERLGQGGGFYDRLLAGTRRPACPVIGVSYDFQIVDAIPTEPTDMTVDAVATNEQFVIVSGQ
ncbi:MAG: 5-formyltetrahydrofolate cyclo-ligase [Planctomycetota bacterium]